MQRTFGAGGTLHVAIIMDGNGRWAAARGRPRPEGHVAGAQSVRRVVEAAPPLGVTDLTLYAFSSDNWGRPAMEVAALMRLLREYLEHEAARCVAEGVRVSVIGRRDRLSDALRRAIARCEAATSDGRVLHLRLAVDYSARFTLARMATELAARGGSDANGDRRGPVEETVARAMARQLGVREAIPDVDLLIRTGGEQRLSDFLLWECAYAELYFTRRAWPDFGQEDLELALADYRRRVRRFGLVEGGEVAV